MLLSVLKYLNNTISIENVDKRCRKCNEYKTESPCLFYCGGYKAIADYVYKVYHEHLNV